MSTPNVNQNYNRYLHQDLVSLHLYDTNVTHYPHIFVLPLLLFSPVYIQDAKLLLVALYSVRCIQYYFGRRTCHIYRLRRLHIFCCIYHFAIFRLEHRHMNNIELLCSDVGEQKQGLVLV